MKNVNKLNNIWRQLSITLGIMLIILTVTGCSCKTYPIAGQSSSVAVGTIDENGNPAPGDALCTSGNKCADSGNGCGLFPYRNRCSDTWNSMTGECKCVCGD